MKIIRVIKPEPETGKAAAAPIHVPIPIPVSPVPPVPEERLAVDKPTESPPPALREEQLVKALGELKKNIEEQLRKNASEMAKLTAEVTALRQTVAELQKDVKRPEPVLSPAPTVPQKAPVVIQPVETEKPAPLPKPVEPVKLVPISKSIEPEKPLPILKPEPKVDPHAFLDALAAPQPGDQPQERNVAFLKKLWDYLNETAFELPSNKSGRTR